MGILALPVPLCGGREGAGGDSKGYYCPVLLHFSLSRALVYSTPTLITLPALLTAVYVLCIARKRICNLEKLISN